MYRRCTYYSWNAKYGSMFAVPDGYLVDLELGHRAAFHLEHEEQFPLTAISARGYKAVLGESPVMF